MKRWTQIKRHKQQDVNVKYKKWKLHEIMRQRSDEYWKETDIRYINIYRWLDSHLYYGAFIPFCIFKVALNEKKSFKMKHTAKP